MSPHLAPSLQRLRLLLLRFGDYPLSWAVAGFGIGLGLGVTTASAWLVAAGLGGFVFYLMYHGPAREANEGRLFAGGVAFMMAWMVGFVVHSLAF